MITQIVYLAIAIVALTLGLAFVCIKGGQLESKINDLTLRKMKKLLLLALLTTMVVGCKENTNNDRNYATSERGYTYEVTVIDSCEYICTYYYKLAHKGNCRFCTERNKRMVREQVDSILLEIFD